MSQDRTQQPIIIAPSYPAPSFEDLQDLAHDVAQVAFHLQVDIVDGIFVPALSWPFTQPDTDPVEELGRLLELPSEIILEMDCMVVDPVQYLDTFVKLGLSRVIIHYGSTNNYEECIEHARANDYLIGIAFVPSVDWNVAADLIKLFDYVQVMGISEVGAQGQPFDESALDLIMTIKQNFPEKEIAVDGSVNATTIPALVTAGATRLAPGSAIVRAANRADAYATLSLLANNEQ